VCFVLNVWERTFMRDRGYQRLETDPNPVQDAGSARDLVTGNALVKTVSARGLHHRMRAETSRRGETDNRPGLRAGSANATALD